MSATTTQSANPSAHSPPATRTAGGLLRPVAAGVSCLLACGLASQEGLLALLGAAAGALACAMLARDHASHSNSSETAEVAEPTTLARAVVPAWKTQVELAREHSEKSMGQMLDSFSALSAHLDMAVTASTDHTPEDSRDFVDKVIADNEVHVATLSQSVREAVQTRKRTHQQIQTFANALSELRKLSNEVKSIARSTNLVAINAAIEAHRAGAEGHSFAVVAAEVRKLAGLSSDTGDRIGQRLQQIETSINELKGDRSDEFDSEEALVLSSEHAARKVVTELLGSASRMADSTRDLRDASKGVRQQIEELMVSLQHQDRFSQMLGSITQDMQRFQEWMQRGEISTPAQAADWLEQLERSFTTEEQRTQHHGTTAVHTSGGVDFF